MHVKIAVAIKHISFEALNSNCENQGFFSSYTRTYHRENCWLLQHIKIETIKLEFSKIRNAIKDTFLQLKTKQFDTKQRFNHKTISYNALFSPLFNQFFVSKLKADIQICNSTKGFHTKVQCTKVIKVMMKYVKLITETF